MKRVWLALAFAILLVGLAGSCAPAQKYPSQQGFVNDFASVLTEGGKTDLDAILTVLEADTTAEVAVVTVTSLDNSTIEDYAVGLFEAWAIGKKDKDNGVLLLVVTEPLEVRIEVGYGLEAIITDGRAGRILDEEVMPYLRDGNFDDGIVAGVWAMDDYIREATPTQPAHDNSKPSILERLLDLPLPLPVLIILSIITLFLGVSVGRRVGGGGSGGGGASRRR
ncbi:MAG: TPM domain-containing protein [Chloroflexi bacterium]|nr:TPM domain-containing protein [Chloroflexota bacterium]